MRRAPSATASLQIDSGRRTALNPRRCHRVCVVPAAPSSRPRRPPAPHQSQLQYIYSAEPPSSLQLPHSPISPFAPPRVVDPIKGKQAVRQPNNSPSQLASKANPSSPSQVISIQQWVSCSENPPARPVPRRPPSSSASSSPLVASCSGMSGADSSPSSAVRTDPTRSYDTGTISGILAMDAFKEQFARSRGPQGNPVITSSEQSLIVSILSAGTFFGALGASMLADWIGRRLGLIAACLVFTVGVVLQTAAAEQNLFIAGRAAAGFGVGLLSAIVPLYQSESAPKWIRGTIVGCYQWAITIGLFLASCANQATMNRPDSGAYRIPIAIQFLWALILAGGMIALPETPRYLIMKDDYDGAAKALSRLRKLPVDDHSLMTELEEIRANHDFEMRLGKGTWADCFKAGMAKRTLTGCAIQALQQLTGINFIIYYGTTFFISAGIKNAFTIALTINLINVFSTVPGLWLVEKAGRRQLLLWGAIGMASFHFTVATVAVTFTGSVANNILIVNVCFFIAFFAASWGPAPWVVTGEIFPLKTRAKSLSLTTASNWLVNWALAYSTPYLVDKGPHSAGLGAKVFFIWGSCTSLAVVFVYCFVYETKGLSLEEVDEMYHSVSSARHSPGWVPTQDYRENLRNGKDGLGQHIEEKF